LPPIAEHAERIRGLAGVHDLVVVEGAGGVLVRLDDGDGTLADLAASLRPLLRGVLVVVHAGLGTLNHSELTVQALVARRLPVLGLVIGDWPDPGGTRRAVTTSPALPRLCRGPAARGSARGVPGPWTPLASPSRRRAGWRPRSVEHSPRLVPRPP
jgi:dethiobiotin synthetase